MSQALDRSEEIGHRVEQNRAFAEAAAGGNLTLQLIVVAKEQLLADADLPSGPDEAFPLIGIEGDLPGKKYLDFSKKKVSRCRVPGTQRLGSGPAPAAIQSGRKHTRVIENQEVVPAEQLGKVSEAAIAYPARIPRQVEQPRGRAIGERFLGDEPLGKMVVEFCNPHVSRL